jgi:predicted alpha/beta superfamily hydrolase
MDWLALLIPLAPFGLGGLWIWTRHQSKMLDKQKELMLLGKNAPESEDGRRMNEDMKYLKERVATLEKIVTDERGTRELESEIAKLRDS